MIQIRETKKSRANQKHDQPNLMECEFYDYFQHCLKIWDDTEATVPDNKTSKNWKK